MKLLLPFALRRGYTLLKEGETEAALAYFIQLTQKYPHQSAPFFEVGKIYFKRGQLARSQDYLLLAADRVLTPEIIQGILEITNWWMISSPRFFNFSPAFSPDGRKLLYCSAREDTNQDSKVDAKDRAALYLFDLESGSERELRSNAHHHSEPLWSPDGEKVLYFSERPQRQLYAMDLETGEERVILEGHWQPRHPVFTPDGTQLIVCTVDQIGGPSGLSVLDWKTLSRRTLASHAWEHTAPHLSSDGKSVLFVSWRHPSPSSGRLREGHPPGIYLRSLHSNREVQVVKDDYENAYPRFSPNGKSILFLSRRHDTNGDGRIDSLDNYGIYTLDLSSGRERCVSADTYYNKFASWSPDGRCILFVGHWPQRAQHAWMTDDYYEYKGLYRISVKGGSAKTIVSDKFFGSRFCEVCPRGSLVSYVSWRPTTNRGLYIADYHRLPTPAQLRGFIQNNLPF